MLVKITKSIDTLIYGALRLKLLLCVAIVLILFYFILDFQRKHRNPKATYNILLQEEKIVPLRTWKVKLKDCVNYASSAPNMVTSCSDLVHGKMEVTLPDAAAPKIWATEYNLKANTARLTYTLNDDLVRWVEAQPSVFLVIPRSVHEFVRIRVENSPVQESNFLGASPVFWLKRKPLIETRSIDLEWNFGDYPWFGPADLPIVLTTEEHAVKYGQLPYMQITMGNQLRNLEIGFPLLLAAVAVVLDHTLLFSFLSFFAGSRALRSYVYFNIENQEFELIGVWRSIFLGAQGLTFAFLVLLVAEIALFTLPKRNMKAMFLMLSVAASLTFVALDPKYSVKLDLWSDLWACGFGFFVIIGGGIRFFKNWKKDQEKRKSEGLDLHQSVILTPFSYYLRNILLFAALGIHFWANYVDLVYVKDSELKDILDWKHQILFPALIVAALIEVGSTTKKMQSYGMEMAQKAVLEKDLSVGQEVQRRMLPARKKSGLGVEWRSLYVPATALAGDWYDVRELHLLDGSILTVACVADVTGHGVGSSLATSVISSHWGLWCAEVARQNQPESLDSMKMLLGRAPKAIHEGLSALRNNEHSTAICFMLCPESGRVVFTCASHPGLMAVNQDQFRYLFTSGSRLGAVNPEEQLSWEVKDFLLLKGESVFLYTDGIQPPGVGVSQWSASLKRVFRKNPSGFSRIIYNQIRQNRKSFKLNPRIEDDMTLLVISRKLEEGTVV